ncbi:MAG: MoaD/ThiS family protein [Candidatus Bathyarchaeia archaeon]
MIRIRVKYFLIPQIKPNVGEVSIEVPRLWHLIKKLEMSYGKDILKELFSPFTLMLINGRQVHYVNGFDVELRNGDEITFLRIVDGG